MTPAIQRYKMVVTIGQDLGTREVTSYITHALNQEDADRRLKKFVDNSAELKNKRVYCCKAIPM